MRLRRAQVTGKVVSGVSVRELEFEWVDWVKKISPHQWGWASSSLLRARIEQKGREGWICSLLDWRQPSSPASDSSVPSLWDFRLGAGLRPPGLEWNFSTGFPEPEDGSSWERFSLHHCMSQLPVSLSTYSHISFWFCFSGESRLIQGGNTNWIIIL